MQLKHMADKTESVDFHTLVVTAVIQLADPATRDTDDMVVVMTFMTAVAKRITPLASEMNDPEEHPAVGKGFEVAVNSRQTALFKSRLKTLLHL
jgi:hypothetical protein